MIPRQSIGLTSTADNLISWIKNHSRILAGNISFGSSTSNSDLSRNINGWWYTVTTPSTANTQFTVPHGLQRIPIGFDLKRNNTSGVVYDSGTTWTSSDIYLKCSVASAAITIFIF